MKKFYKRISLALVFVVTLLTCSGCFKTGEEESSNGGEVGLIGVSSSNTVRFMDESIYLGYLGAQRDFALIVDNASWNQSHQEIAACGENGDGCASVMAKLLMFYGIKTANFTGSSGGENLLLYYTPAKEFMNFGKGSWYEHLTGSAPEDNFDDKVIDHSCGAKNSLYVCTYAKDMANNGFSARAGSSMILLFHNGSLSSVITDKDLDPEGKLNVSGKNYDNIKVTNTAGQQQAFTEYYNKIINVLKRRIHVVNAANVTNDKETEEREIIDLNSLSELQRVVNSDDSFLLLITSNGFITEKIGANSYLSEQGTIKEESTQFDEENSNWKRMSLLFNTVTSYIDNCALKSNPMLNFLKDVLESLIAGAGGALIGAAAGAGIGAAIGSIIPGVGTAVGAVVGAVIGAIAGFIAGIVIDKAIEEKLNDAQGIATESYCKIMSSALSGVELNVPVYHYNIKSAKDNISTYDNGTMDSTLRSYYQANYNKCRNQNVTVGVPDGIASLFAPALESKYAYADACEADVVESMVGGFGGAPSLQLYLNGKKADDLHGRVTTELVNEMLSVWNLKDLGEMYSLGGSSTLGTMNIALASAQKIKSAEWCVGTGDDLVPSCDGKNTYPISIPSNHSYVSTFDKDKAIKLDFTDTYKNFSRENARTSIGSVDNMHLNFAFEENGSPVNRNMIYYKKSLSSNNWEILSVNPSLDEAATQLLNLQTSIRDDIKEHLNDSGDSNLYQVKFKNNNYIIMDNNHVVGYNSNKQIVYYNDGNEEYVFNGGDNIAVQSDSSLNDAINSLYFTNLNYTNNSTQVRAVDDFRVYIKYTYDHKYKDEDDKTQTETRTAYFQYMI